MKIICIFSLVFLYLIFTPAFSLTPEEEKQADINCELVQQFLSAEVRKFKKINRSPAGGPFLSIPNGKLKYLGFSLQVEGPLPKDEIRKRIVTYADEFFKDLSTNKTIESVLLQYPMSIDTIRVEFHMIDKTNAGLRYPHITFADLHWGVITYTSFIKGGSILDAAQSSETLEEARKILAIDALKP